MLSANIVLSSLFFLVICEAEEFGAKITVPVGDSCTWRGGDYGDISQCLNDEVPVGSCGSGKDPDCNNPDSGEDNYDMIYCCPLAYYSYDNCFQEYADYGDDLTCLSGDVVNDLIVEAVCGSGKDEDCDGYSHMISCCEGTFSGGEHKDENLHSVGDCTWTYADYGDVLMCSANDEAIFGRCGSGGDPDCNGSEDYHGIQCCKLGAF